MILPEAAEREFWQELQTFEEERKVTYVTNAERFGFERGVQEGKKEGRQEGESSLVLRLLKRRLGGLSPEMEAQILALSLTHLEELGEALLDFSQLSDLSDWLQASHS
jgi:predicted transposase YdaD